jgi:hypothetical protein
VLIVETGPVSERLRVREIDDGEGRRLIRRYITWRNNHADDERLRRVTDRANAA